MTLVSLEIVMCTPSAGPVSRAKVDLATIRLKDGRTLAYAECGRPDGAPLFYFHGVTGCRLERPAGIGPDVAERVGIRLLAVDRPGCGESTRQKGRRVLDWAADVGELADALRLNRFAVAGWSAGGPHALACAYAMPSRVVAVAVMGGTAPREAYRDGLGSLAPGIRRVARMSRWAPPLASAYLRLVRRVASRDPDRWREELARTVLRAAPDRALVAGPLGAELVDIFLAATCHGVAGGVDDYRAITGDWGFQPERIDVPVRWLHGELDESAPVTWAQWTAERMPSAEFIIASGEGHLHSDERVLTLWKWVAQRSASVPT
jgi:pimeloyl-ACP methyl ester carboxylesterase